jgi:hypothetical protein
MNTPHTRAANLRQWVTGVMVAGVVGSFLLFAPAATAATVYATVAAAVSAAPTVPAALSIAITDGVAETASGSTSDYTATVTNGGTAAVTGELVITLPRHATYTDAKGAHIDKADAAWQVTVAPGKSETRRATVDVGQIPKGEVRVTTLATLYAPGDRARILVRAADANAIHGIVDPAHTVGQKPKTAVVTPSDPTPLIAGIVTLAVLLALVGTSIVLFRRRKRQSCAVPIAPEDAKT